MNGIRNFIVAAVVMLAVTACATLYRNPTGENITPVYGSFDNKEEFGEFWERQYTFKKNISGERFEHPLLMVHKVDGKEVSNRDVPTYVTEGHHVVEFKLTDRVRSLTVRFEADFDASIKYIVKYSLRPLENTEVAELWIENYDTGEILSEKKSAAFLPESRQTIVVPLFL